MATPETEQKATEAPEAEQKAPEAAQGAQDAGKAEGDGGAKATEATEAEKGEQKGEKKPVYQHFHKKLIGALKEDDDERATISKKVSWVLRHVAERLHLEPEKDQDAGGNWYKISDLLKLSVLEGVTEEKLLSVIQESNADKLRYELKGDNTLIRAISKAERRPKDATLKERRPAKEARSRREPPEPPKSQALRSDAPVFVPGAKPVEGFTMPTVEQYAAAAAAMGYPWGLMGGNPHEFSGRIASYNAEKGFGFIDSPEARGIFGRDVFVHRTKIGNLTVGTEVTFKVETNKQNMPQAKDVVARAGWKGKGGKGDKGQGKGEKGKGRGRGKGRGEGNQEAGEESKEAAPAEAAATSEAAAPAATESGAKEDAAPKDAAA